LDSEKELTVWNMEIDSVSKAKEAVPMTFKLRVGKRRGKKG